MCGIAGYTWSDSALIKKMIKKIRHRGPDDYGFWNDSSATFGHARLSVIDLSKKAKQPMFYEHRNKFAVIVYNGEIYNFLEIKKELESRGYRFNTVSDTEVILASFMEWGEGCIDRLDGMFAFAIYDGKKLFFARDRAGEKPFYYFYDGQNFAFASELKALLSILEKVPTMDDEAIDLYLSLNFIPAPWTIYKEFRKLRAAEYGIFDLKTKKLSIKNYRVFPKYLPSATNEEILTTIEKSTLSRAVADVPVGLIMSGGLDSTTVAYFLYKKLDNLSAYSVGFEVNDESTLAEKFAEELGLRFIRVPFSKEDFIKMHDIIFYQYDEPFGDHSVFPTMKVAKAAKRDMTVALSGDGGDEIFGGYDYYRKAYIVEKLKSIKNPFLNILLKTAGYFNRSARELYAVYSQPWENFKTFSASYERYSTEIAKDLSRSTLKYLLEKYPPVEALIKYDYVFNNLPDQFLVKTDRATMTWALELRSPFLSNALWELSARIDYKEKVWPNTKNILRKIMKNKLPEYLLKRRKQGFSAPIITYMLEDKDIIVDKIVQLRKRIPKHKNFLDYIKEKTRKGEAVKNSIQYRLYALEMWFEKWVDKNNL